METFSALLAICAGNSPVPGEFPAQRPVTRSFDVFFDLCLNKRLSKPWWGWWFETLSLPLWRHRHDCVDTGRNPLIPLGTRYNTWLWTSGLVNGLASCWHQAIKQINDDKDYQSIVILLQTFPIFHLHLHCHRELQGDELREIQTKHDDVIKWKHFPRYWPFVRGIHRSPVNSLHKGQWRGALMFSLICVWINGWVNNREAGDLRRYRAHFDVTVMEISHDFSDGKTPFCTSHLFVVNMFGYTGDMISSLLHFCLVFVQYLQTNFKSDDDDDDDHN